MFLVDIQLTLQLPDILIEMIYGFLTYLLQNGKSFLKIVD